MTAFYHSKTKTTMSILRDITGWITVVYVLILLTVYLACGFTTERSVWCIGITTLIYGSFILTRCTAPSWRRLLTADFFKHPTLAKWYGVYMQNTLHKPHATTYRIDTYLELSFASKNPLIPFTITCPRSNHVLAIVFGDYILAQMKDYPTSYGIGLVFVPESDEFWR